MRIDKATSNRIGKLAREFRLLLTAVDRKYFDPEKYGPDLYAKDYDQLSKLADEMMIYLG
jgi:hypothetical protein